MATYFQVDWTGEEPVNDFSDRCFVCSSPLLNLRGDLFGAGRLSLYCSDSCKMKAYRKRLKALRNAQPKIVVYSPQYVVAGFESEEAFLQFHFVTSGGAEYACFTEEEARLTGKAWVYISGGCLGRQTFRSSRSA